MSIDDLIRAKLPRQIPAQSADWAIWELKNLNIHRAVLRVRAPNEARSYSEIASAVREQVAKSFRVAWWRGFAFGTVIEVESIPRDIAVVVDSIDTRDRTVVGTWQWTVVACASQGAAFGVHTWREGRLTPLYKSLLDHFRSEACQIGSFKKEKGPLMNFLISCARLHGAQLPEFEP